MIIQAYNEIAYSFSIIKKNIVSALVVNPLNLSGKARPHLPQPLRHLPGRLPEIP
jgi:hypothetical protein